VCVYGSKVSVQLEDDNAGNSVLCPVGLDRLANMDVSNGDRGQAAHTTNAMPGIPEALGSSADLTMPRPQFSIRTLLWLTLVVTAFFAGMLFEKERRRREDEAAALTAKAAQGRVQGRARMRIKQGGFEFSFNSEDERRNIANQLAPFLNKNEQLPAD
jgi:hypothetical protein